MTRHFVSSYELSSPAFSFLKEEPTSFSNISPPPGTHDYTTLFSSDRGSVASSSLHQDATVHFLTAFYLKISVSCTFSQFLPLKVDLKARLRYQTKRLKAYHIVCLRQSGPAASDL